MKIENDICSNYEKVVDSLDFMRLNYEKLYREYEKLYNKVEYTKKLIKSKLDFSKELDSKYCEVDPETIMLEEFLNALKYGEESYYFPREGEK